MSLLRTHCQRLHHFPWLVAIFLFSFVASTPRATAARVPAIRIPAVVRPPVPPNAPRTHIPSPSPKPRVNLKLPENVTKLYINVSPNLSPMLPPENDDSVAVLVLEPNAGVARELRRKMSRHFKKLDEERMRKKKKKSTQSSRMIVLNCGVEGPPLTDLMPTFQNLDLDRGRTGSVPILTLDEILKTLPPNLQLHVM